MAVEPPVWGVAVVVGLVVVVVVVEVELEMAREVSGVGMLVATCALQSQE